MQNFQKTFFPAHHVVACGEGERKGLTRRKVQTTFAPPEGHNLHAIPSSVKGEKTLEEVMTRLPYSFSSPIAEQIHASIASSLKNLETSDDGRDTYIDCLILRSPYPTRAESIEAWKVLSTYVPHPIRSLGVASRQLMGIGEESAAWAEEGRRIVPSVFVNTSKKHNGRDIGFDLDNYPKKDMVFQSSWSTNDMTQVAQNALTFEICCILQELGFEQEESRRLAMQILLLSLRLHGLAILEEGNKVKTLRRDMRALTKLEKYIRGRKGRLRWMRLESAARTFFEDVGWERELPTPYTQGAPRDAAPDAPADVHATSLQDWDVDEVAAAARNPNPNPDPIPAPAPAPAPSTGIASTLRYPPPHPQRNIPHSPSIHRVPSPAPASRPFIPSSSSSPSSLSISRASPRENSAMRKRSRKQEIDRLVREGCSPSVIAKVVQEQRDEARKLRKGRGVVRQRWGIRGGG